MVSTAPISANPLDEALRLIREGGPELGMERLWRIVAAEPDRAEAWGHLANQLISAARHEDAIACIRELLRLNPGDSHARRHLGDRLVRLGRLDEGEAEYRRVLGESSECHDARCGLEYIEWLRRNRRPPAKPSIEPAHEAATAPDPGASDGEAIWRLKSENEQRAREHFARGDTRLTSKPVLVQLETTTRCNLEYAFCVKTYAPHEGLDLRPEHFDLVARELLATAQSVSLSGFGEPMLGRRFDQFHREALRQGAGIYFVTNATALSIERLERFAAGRTVMVASLDGATAEALAKVRRAADFERVVENLRIYKALRQIHAESGAVLWVNFVAARRTIEQLPAVIDLAADLGAETVIALDMMPSGLPPDIAAEHLSFHADLANRVLREARQRARERGIQLQAPMDYAPVATPPAATRFQRLRAVERILPQRRRFPQRCSEPWTSTYVLIDGQVRTCCLNKRALGHLDQDTFEAIWNGRRYRAFRRRIHTFLPPPDCRDCSLNFGINAGNPSAVRAREGLLIKLLYRAEERGKRLLKAICSLLKLGAR